MSRFDEFLVAYREIERALRAITGLQNASETFMGLLRSAREKSPLVARHMDSLRTLHDLRNVLVHRGFKGKTLAEPTQEVVREAQHIAESLVRPPVLPKYVYCQVRVFDKTDTLGNALQFMQQEDYSQVPMADGKRFARLLTTNDIALWLASNVNEEIVEIKSTPLSEVVCDRDSKNAYQFCSSKASCEKVIAVFEEAHEKGELLQAVLLTDSGKPDAHIRGIVTAHDLGKLYRQLH